MKNRIYYFTGTGNSMRAAQKIGMQLGDCEIISMKCSPEEYPAEECDVVGFVFPVYHWTMPEPAVEFVKNLKINPNAYIFCIAMPSLICGEACEALEKILAEKNIKINYGTKVHNVANYVIYYPPMPSPKIVVPKTERKLDKIAEDIKQRKSLAIPRAGGIVRMKMKGMSKYKRFLKDSDYGFEISGDCVSCGICTKVCPVGNIELKDGKPNFKHNCAQCMACISYCPKSAISYRLTDEVLQKAKANPSDFKFFKLIGSTKGRKPYHHPNVSAADIMNKATKL